MTELYGSDAYAPSQVARRVETVGVAKARNLVGGSVLVGLAYHVIYRVPQQPQ